MSQHDSKTTADRLPMPYSKGYYGTPSPRCFECNSIVYISNGVCSQCGQVNILPEDIENERL